MSLFIIEYGKNKKNALIANFIFFTYPVSKTTSNYRRTSGMFLPCTSIYCFSVQKILQTKKQNKNLFFVNMQWSWYRTAANNISYIISLCFKSCLYCIRQSLLMTYFYVYYYYFVFLFFLAFDFCRFYVVIRFFMPATTANDL